MNFIGNFYWFILVHIIFYRGENGIFRLCLNQESYTDFLSTRCFIGLLNPTNKLLNLTS